MEIIFVRHGEPQWSRGGVGVDDPPLTERGQRQAVAAAASLADFGVDEVFVSPLSRARQTAAPIAEALGLTPTTHDWLAEIHPGNVDGTPIELVEEAFAENRGRSIEALWDGMPDGESFRDFHDRVTSGMSVLLTEIGAVERQTSPSLWSLRSPERRVVIVAHAGTNAVLLGYLLGIDPTPWEWERFVSFHASISTVRPMRISDGWSFSLFRFSDVEHLPADLRTR